jgi:2-hydroxymuconate-semialdehyde hydrolase
MSRSTLLAGLPVTERRLAIAGVRTTLLTGGDGPPLVLLHGGIEIGGAYWAPIIPALAQYSRLVVPDVPGLGESDPFAGPVDQAAFDTWMMALLAETCAGPPALVAHSLLGGYAARFAARHAGRLTSLAIYGAPAIGPFRMPLGLLVTAILFDVHPSARAQQRFLKWAFLDPARAQHQHPEWFDAFNALCVERGRIPHVKRTMRQLITYGTRRIPDATLGGIGIPTALLWGRQDRMTPLRLAERAEATLGWPLHVVEGAGHAPHLEQPDRFLRALSGALGTAPAASAPAAR